MPRINILALILAGLPWAAVAAELGQINAFLDGEERVWHTITMEQGDRQIATATWQQRPYLAELLLQGHPVPEFTSKEALSIDTSFGGQYASGNEPISVEILYTPNGLSGPLWTSRGAPVEARLQIIELEIWGGVGRLVAVITGQVCMRPRLFSQTDVTDCKMLNGKIETRLVVN